MFTEEKLNLCEKWERLQFLAPLKLVFTGERFEPGKWEKRALFRWMASEN
jgi:hypothetical protein